MTANEMRNLFKELYDGASAQEMGFDDTEVSRFFNLSQNAILNEKIFSNRNVLREGFEIGSKREIELNNLKRTLTLWYDVTTSEWVIRNQNEILDATVTITTDGVMLNDSTVTINTIMNDNSISFELPNTVLYILRDTCDVKYNDIVYRDIEIKNLNEDETNTVLKSPFRKPDLSVIYRTLHMFDTDSEKQVKLYLDNSFDFKRWNCTYIKRPVEIVVDILIPSNQVDCELDDIIHNDIVFKAVEFALGSIGSQKTQLSMYNSKQQIN